MREKRFKIIAKTLSGLEEVLARELESIGAKEIDIKRRAVFFQGTPETLYRSNLQLRTSLSILVPIESFRAKNEKQLYQSIKDINWSDYLDFDDTFYITPIVSSDYFKHSHYVAQKAKDAIADQFRESKGMRPSVNKENPTIKINLHITNDRGTVSLDSSGDALFKRGYRQYGSKAPINEVLAAGMIMLSDWDGKSLLIDPMCGSGTIIIEAAMIALNRAPNINRKQFGFMKWKSFDKQLFNNIVEDIRSKEKQFCPRIIGSDISPQAVKTARRNIKHAGLDDYITTRVNDISEFIKPSEKGTIITNPPYGERIENEEIISLYQKTGNTLKHTFSGFSAWIISSNTEAMKNIGLRHSRNIKLFNGPLECKFRKYELYEGSLKEK